MGEFELKQKDKVGRFLFNVVLIILIAVFTSTMITTFVVRRYEVRGRSMQTTLNPGDTVWILCTKHVKSGDIVAIDWKESGEKYPLIKRVVAVGGETVYLDGSSVKVIGADGIERTAYDHFTDSHGLRTTSVPEGYIYAMGDNIDISLDSTELGPVAIGEVIGRKL